MPSLPNSEVSGIQCFNCDVHITDGTQHIVIDTMAGEVSVCERCLDMHYISCDRCGDHVSADDTELITDYGTYGGRLCEGCQSYHSVFQCDDCADFFTGERLQETDGGSFCNLCYGSREEEDRDFRRQADTKSERLIDTTPGKIITSKRHFGVELETVFNEQNAASSLADILDSGWGFDEDGSIRRSKDALDGVEIVSPILAGKKGEDEICKLSDNANKLGFSVNTSCGFHLHLAAPEFVRDEAQDIQELPRGEMRHGVVYFARHPLQDAETLCYDYDDIPIYHGKKVPFRTETREVDNAITVNRGKSFYLLRDLWYIYLVFDDVFRAMQPPSRRNNTFCKATSAIYSLDRIRDLDDYGALERMWYKIDRRLKLKTQWENAEERKGYEKDSTRYSGFNLEPLLREYKKLGTIEIRYHSPTLNARKILSWVDLHQTIFDRVARGAWDEEAVNYALTNEPDIGRKAKMLCAIFGIKKETEKYILERLHKFNKLKSNQNQLEDEEVDFSDIGTPLHRSENIARLRRPDTDASATFPFTVRFSPEESEADSIMERLQTITNQINGSN